MKESIQGALTIFLVYIFWGAMPVYWKAIEHIKPAEILAHRIVWSCVLSFFLVAAMRKTSVIISLFRSNRRALLLLLFSSMFVSINWGLYIWAVNNGRILESSLGYFINPLTTILFGLVFFKESLNKIQWISIGFAAAGVCSEVVMLGYLPFVSLGLALSFTVYSLLKKLSAVESLAGFAVETIFITPFALSFLIWCQYSGTAHFPYDLWTTLLLIGSGIVTSTPLILFAWGVKRCTMTTVGLIQYTSPILMFVTGTVVYHEPVLPMRLLSFVLIWISIIIFTAESFRRSKRTAGG